MIPSAGLQNRCSIILGTLLLLVQGPLFAGSADDSLQPSAKKSKVKVINLQEELNIFYPINNAEYSVSLCADLPVNDNPERVYKKGETGHVFLTLSKKLSTGITVHRSFGFYPRVAVTFLLKQVRAMIMDNSNRDYDASIEKKVSPAEFAMVLQKCLEFARKKYNLKNYNCYDYALGVFNSLPGIEKLPVTYVKFPFIFGKGGSPCGLYKDLKRLSATTSAWASFIRFGELRSPGDPPENAFASH